MNIGRLLQGAVTNPHIAEPLHSTRIAHPSPMSSATRTPKWGTPNADDAWEDDNWEDVADASPASKKAAPTPPRPAKPATAPAAAPAAVPAATPTTVPAVPPPPGNADKVASLRAELEAVQKRAKVTELKLFAVTRERDSLRRGRDSRSAGAALIKQKDEQIKAVLAEGEQLSIKIAEKETAARALKAHITALEEQLEERDVAVGAAEARAEAARTRERAAENAQRAATDARDAAEKRVRALESGASTQTAAALESSRTELEAAKRAATDALRATEARLASAHEAELAKRGAAAHAREAALSKALDELRARLVDDADTAGAREDRLRRDVIALRKRASSLEARNEELAAEVPSATRPLIRQIEALQSASAERALSANNVERTLVTRANIADQARAAAVERARAADERADALGIRVAALQEQVRIARSASDALDVELASVKENAASEYATLAKEVRREAERARQAAKARDETLAELRNERAVALDAADAAETREKELQEKVSALEAKLELAREAGAHPTTPGARPPSGLSSSRNSLSEIAAMVASASGAGSVPVSPRFDSGISDMPNSTSVANGLYATERMAATLRQRVGEVQSLQKQLREKEEGTKALAEEVVSLTGQLETLSKQVKDAPSVKDRLDELEKRHATLLELLGEREERIGEVEADLFDVKEMYKEQVNELLNRIEKLHTTQQ